MATAGRLQKKKKVACSYNAYHSQTERDIDRNQKRVKGRSLSWVQPTLRGILIYVCPPLYIEKKTINSNKLSCPGASGVCFDRGDESQTQTCCLLWARRLAHLRTAPSSLMTSTAKALAAGQTHGYKPSNRPSYKASPLQYQTHKRLIWNKENRRMKLYNCSANSH